MEFAVCTPTPVTGVDGGLEPHTIWVHLIKVSAPKDVQYVLFLPNMHSFT